MEASLGSFRKPNVYYYEGGRVHLIKMQRKPSGSYKSDQPPHSPIIRTNCKEAALLKFKTMSCHNSLISNLGIGSLKKSFWLFYKQNIYLVSIYNKIT